MKKSSPQKSIRKKCLSYSNHAPKDARFFPIQEYPLFSYRFKENPARAGLGRNPINFNKISRPELGNTTKKEVSNDESGNS